MRRRISLSQYGSRSSISGPTFGICAVRIASINSSRDNLEICSARNFATSALLEKEPVRVDRD